MQQQTQARASRRTSYRQSGSAWSESIHYNSKIDIPRTRPRQADCAGFRCVPKPHFLPSAGLVVRVKCSCRDKARSTEPSRPERAKCKWLQVVTYLVKPLRNVFFKKFVFYGKSSAFKAFSGVKIDTFVHFAIRLIISNQKIYDIYTLVGYQYLQAGASARLAYIDIPLVVYDSNFWILGGKVRRRRANGRESTISVDPQTGQ